MTVTGPLQDAATATFTLLSEAELQAWPLLLAQAAGQASGTAVDPCPELTRRLDIDLKEVVRAGCEPSQAQIAQLMSNPVGNLILLVNQFDYLQIKGPRTGGIRDLFIYKLIPTFPLSLGENWNLINRVALSVPSVPLKKEAGDFIGLGPSEVVQQRELFNVLPDPFGRTTGFGDLVYVGLVAPKKSIKTENGGAFIWGVGPTFIFPTASASVLGQGKYQVGPAAVFAYLGQEWILGVFPQQWWSYAGNDRRPDTSLMNIQYFIYRKLPHDIQVGMSPNITINWKADGGNQVPLPIGLGASFMVKLGKLPARIGLEAYYSVFHPEDTAGSRWDIRFSFTPVIPTFLF